LDSSAERRNWGFCGERAERDFQTEKTRKALDRQRERFYNKDVNALAQELVVELYSTENEEKSSVVGRWNRTMKEKMFKYFTANNTNIYIDVLDDFVERYNNTRHSSIKMTPVESSKKNNEVTVYRNLYPDFERRPMRAKFKIGDKV